MEAGNILKTVMSTGFHGMMGCMDFKSANLV